MNMNGSQAVEASREAVYAATFAGPEAPAKGRLGKLIGAVASALVAVTLSANLCCVNGHHHEVGDPFMVSMCTARLPPGL
jgi:hypothetical protein